jgi:hypothetical protein
LSAAKKISDDPRPTAKTPRNKGSDAARHGILDGAAAKKGSKA